MSLEQHDQYENTEYNTKENSLFGDQIVAPDEVDHAGPGFREFAQLEEQKDTIEQVQTQLSDLKNTIYTPDKQSLLDQQFDNGLPYHLQAGYQQRDLSTIA